MKLLLKSLFVFLSTLFALILSATPALAQTDSTWLIPEFRSIITINPDTSVNISETIVVNFGQTQKHGIYRTIPVDYRTNTGHKHNIRFRLLSVQDQTGQELDYELSRTGDSVKIKIGDPDKTVIGLNTYVIDYQVNRVITSPEHNPELFWNVTGNDWPVPILKAQATVIAPDTSIENTICFADYFAGTSQDCTHGHDTTRAQFTAIGLDTGRGLSVATKLNPELITPPSRYTTWLWFLQDNWPYAIPLLVLAFMSRLFWLKGRDRQFKHQFDTSLGAHPVPLFSRLNPSSVYGPPEDLTPSEVGVLIDEKVHLRDITASVIDLARLGFITIKETKPKSFFSGPKFTLTYHPQDETALPDYQLAILDMLFTKSRKTSVKLDKLPKNSYQYLEKAQSALYQHLVDHGYFTGNPNTVRTAYFVAGFITIFAGIALGSILSSTTSPLPLVLSVSLSGLIILAFAPFMPARSAKGRRALRQVAGLKRWLELGAWREQIHEKNNFFEEVLPYTIALGLTGKFIRAFKDANLKNPDWYQSSGRFNPVAFNNSISTFDSSLNSSVASTRPKSSGGSGFSGGSSGGGFGGGGGGSW